MSIDDKTIADLELKWAVISKAIKENGITIDREYVKRLEEEFSEQHKGALFTDEEIRQSGKHLKFEPTVTVHLSRPEQGANSNGDDFSSQWAAIMEKTRKINPEVDVVVAPADQRAVSMSKNFGLNFGFHRTKCPRRPHRNIWDGLPPGRLFMISSFDSREVRIVAEMTSKCAGATSLTKECSWVYIGGVSNVASPDAPTAQCHNGNALDLHREYPLSALKIDRSQAKTAQWGQLFYDPIYLMKPATKEEREQTAKLTEKLKEYVRNHPTGIQVMSGARRLPPPGLLDIPENPTIQPMTKRSVTPDLAGFNRAMAERTPVKMLFQEDLDLASPKEEAPFDFDRYNGVKK